MTLWDKRLNLARRNLIRMANTTNAPDYLLAEHSRLFLKAYHQGPWRMLVTMTRYEFRALWRRRGWLKWEWIRTRVFRRDPDRMCSIVDRAAEEFEEMDKLTN